MSHSRSSCLNVGHAMYTLASAANGQDGDQVGVGSGDRWLTGRGTMRRKQLGRDETIGVGKARVKDVALVTLMRLERQLVGSRCFAR